MPDLRVAGECGIVAEDDAEQADHNGGVAHGRHEQLIGRRGDHQHLDGAVVSQGVNVILHADLLGGAQAEVLGTVLTPQSNDPFISSFAFEIRENHSIDVFSRPSVPDAFVENPDSRQSPCFQIRLEYNSV